MGKWPCNSFIYTSHKPRPHRVDVEPRPHRVDANHNPNPHRVDVEPRVVMAGHPYQNRVALSFLFF